MSEQRSLPLTDDFLLRVARGQIRGMSLIHKFGHGLSSTVETDIWDNAPNNYVYLSSALTLHVSSSSALDTNAPITLEGCDLNGEFLTEIKSLDGTNSQTQVATVNEFLRIDRVFHKPTDGGLSGGTPLVGDVYVSIQNGDTIAGVPQTPSDIQAKILAGEDQTLMGLFSIYQGFTGFIINFQIRTASAKVLTARLRIRTFDEDTQSLATFRTQDFFEGGIETVDVPIKLAPQIPSRSDIKMTASMPSPAVSVSTIFEVLLVDNDLVQTLSFDKTIIGT